LAYEDETLPYMDRPARRYEMEHYAVAMATGGMWKSDYIEGFATSS
jgi:hypothetical protein